MFLFFLLKSGPSFSQLWTFWSNNRSAERSLNNNFLNQTRNYRSGDNSVEKAVLKNFANFIRNHLWRGLFSKILTRIICRNHQSSARICKNKVFYFWLLLAASDYCLRNKLSFHNFIEFLFSLLIHQIDRKWTVAPYASFNKFYGKMSIGFCLNICKRFFIEVLIPKPTGRLYFSLKTQCKGLSKSTTV